MLNHPDRGPLYVSPAAGYLAKFPGVGFRSGKADCMSISTPRQAALSGPDRRPRLVIGEVFYTFHVLKPACAVGVRKGVRLDPPAWHGQPVLICQYVDPEDGRGCDDPRYLGLSCSCPHGLRGEPCDHLHAAVAHGLVAPATLPPKRQRGLWNHWTDLAIFVPCAGAGTGEGADS